MGWVLEQRAAHCWRQEAGGIWGIQYTGILGSAAKMKWVGARVCSALEHAATSRKKQSLLAGSQLTVFRRKLCEAKSDLEGCCGNMKETACKY